MRKTPMLRCGAFGDLLGHEITNLCQNACFIYNASPEQPI
jgi:hypothetical protein